MSITSDSELVSVAALVKQWLDRAKIMARVELTDGDSPLRLVLQGGRNVPFPHYRAVDNSAVDRTEKWLKAKEIEARVCTDNEDNVVISGTPDAIRKLTGLLTAEYIQAEDAAESLQRALEQRGLSLLEVTTSADGTVVIKIPASDDFAAAVKLGAMLGADNIAEGLELNSLEGAQQLAERLYPVLAKAVGPRVMIVVNGRAGSRPDLCLIVHLVEQATRLTERIAAATPLSTGTTRNSLTFLQQAVLHTIEEALAAGLSPTTAEIHAAIRFSKVGGVEAGVQYLKSHGFLTWKVYGKKRQFVVLAPPATPEEQAIAEAYLRSPSEALALVTKKATDVYANPETQSVRAVAKALGRSFGTAHRMLTKAGVIQPRGHRRPRREPAPKDLRAQSDLDSKRPPDAHNHFPLTGDTAHRQ